jgi:hypothetical protein
MKHAGTCHCGALGFSYETDLAPERWSIRACQCSFCRAHGALSTSDPHGSLSFHASDARQLVRYRFGLRTADFLLCGRCGVYLGAVLVTDSARVGVLNLNALREPLVTATSQPVSYEGEDSSQRAARRLSRWTPIVGSLQFGAP